MSAAACAALFLCAAVPLQLVFWTGWIPLPMRLLAGGLLILAALRPAPALLVLVAIVPFGGVLTEYLGARPIRGAEALALAFLPGWLLAHAGRRRSTLWWADPWSAVLALFAVTVIASGAARLLTMEAGQAPSVAAETFVEFLTRDYLLETGARYGFVAYAALLVEGALLFASVVSLAREDARFAPRLLLVTVGSGVAAAVLSLVRSAMYVRAAGGSAEAVERFLSTARIGGHVSDVNAAGSYFALIWLTIFGLALTGRRRAPWWFAASVPVALALWVTGSRSAVVAAFVVALMAGAWLTLVRRGSAPERVSPAAIILAIAMTLVIIRLYPQGAIDSSAALSMNIRAQFLTTSVRMLATRPIVGVGVGQYYPLSGGFMPPGLRAIYPLEHAHNYYLQIAAELGLTGLILFLAALIVPLRRAAAGLRERREDTRLGGVLAGLSAFLITCLTGHPLLVAEVAFLFWIVLGLAVALAERHAAPDEASAAMATRGPDIRPLSVRATAIVALALVATVPLRTNRDIAAAELTQASYGFYPWEQEPDGVRFRWTGRQAAFYVPATGQVLEIPLRALRMGSSRGPVTVEVWLDGRLVRLETLDGDRWVRVRIPVGADAEARFHRFDLHVDPTWAPARVLEGNQDRRELGVEVGEIAITTRR